jgi:hypothetical protein
MIFFIEKQISPIFASQIVTKSINNFPTAFKKCSYQKKQRFSKEVFIYLLFNVKLKVMNQTNSVNGSKIQSFRKIIKKYFPILAGWVQ